MFKINQRVITPYGQGVITKQETNRVENRYGVKMDSLEGVPFLVDLNESERWKSYPDSVLYFFNSELKMIPRKEIDVDINYDFHEGRGDDNYLL